MKFYRCTICGNEIEMIKDTGNAPFCCGKVMEELIPGTSDGTKEKHVPVCRVCNGDLSCPDIKKIHVMVGSEPHPMSEEHYIEWIVVETDKRVYRKNLTPKCDPSAVFYMHVDEKILNVYGYCNVHGLWKGSCDLKM